MVPGTLSKGDLVVNQVVSWLKSGALDGIPKDITSPYDRINKLLNNVVSNDKVKAYHEANPDRK